MNSAMMTGTFYKRISLALMTFVLLWSCEQMAEVPEDKFIGVWELTGRGMLEGIRVKIDKSDEKLQGRIYRLNENKMVRMFADSADVWVSGISRSSNFEFRLTEKKLAKDLFSVYGLSTSQDFKVEFIDDNTIGLVTDSADPQLATIKYKRVIE